MSIHSSMTTHAYAPTLADQGRTPVTADALSPAAGGSNMKAAISLLGRTTIPGQPEHMAATRAFVARTLGDCAHAVTAILLTNELVTNSLQHSRSRRHGGVITITLIAIPDGIRTEVADEGGATTPALRPSEGCPSELTEDGRGLQLIDMLADRWGCCCETSSTVTWFELIDAVR